MANHKNRTSADWHLTRLADVARIDAKLVDPTHRSFRDLPHINGENIERATGKLNSFQSAAEDRVTSQKFLFEKGDVLYSKLRPYLRKAVISPVRGLCSADMYPLTVDKERILPEFLQNELLSDRFSAYAIEESARSRMPKLNREALFQWTFRLPPLTEQCRIVAALNRWQAEISSAYAKLVQNVSELDALLNVELSAALAEASQQVALGDCLVEIKKGVGETWANHEVLGATRQGLAPAKEPVGKTPQRYKYATVGTIFYNPMRILLGSIALVDVEQHQGIVSPDYVVFHARLERILPRFVYFWLRSQHGANAILDTAKGAVRERMMFKGLAKIRIPLPPLDAQRRFDRLHVAAKSLQAKIEAEQMELVAITPSLLRAAFSGAL